jgi:monoamine oxidase
MSRSFLAQLFRSSAVAPGANQVAAWSAEGIENFLTVFPLDDWLNEPKRKKAKRGDGTPSCAIIGGGLAGLMAGAALAGKYDVTVYEASKVVGGRVRSNTTLAQDHAVEEGGELVGYAHPAWLYLARRFGLPLSPITEDADYTAMGLGRARGENNGSKCINQALAQWRSTLQELATHRKSPRAPRKDCDIERLYQKLSEETSDHFGLSERFRGRVMAEARRGTARKEGRPRSPGRSVGTA